MEFPPDSDLRKEGMQIPHLIWHLARNLIGPHRVLVGLLPKAEIEASKDEGKGDAEPHAEEGQHSGEGDCP